MHCASLPNLKSEEMPVPKSCSDGNAVQRITTPTISRQIHRPWDSNPTLGDQIAKLIEQRLCDVVLRNFSSPVDTRQYANQKFTPWGSGRSTLENPPTTYRFLDGLAYPGGTWLSPCRNLPNVFWYPSYYHYIHGLSGSLNNTAFSKKSSCTEAGPNRALWSSEQSFVEYVNNGHGIKNPCSPGTSENESKSSGEKRKKKTRATKADTFLKRFLCSICGKGFNDTFDLKRHTRTHTGVRPYKCDHCEKSFTQRCSLETHEKKLHGVKFDFGYKQRRTKLFICEECGDATSKIEQHYYHVKNNHPALMLKQH